MKSDSSKSMLRRIFDGEFYPCEDIVCKDPEYRSLCAELDECWQNLYNQPEPDADRRLNNLQSKIIRTQLMESYAYYSAGFRDGVRLMFEVLGNE